MASKLLCLMGKKIYDSQWTVPNTFGPYLIDLLLKRSRGVRYLKTLCQGSSRAGYNYQPISVSIHKVWTNKKPENLALSLAKSDSLASFE